MSRKPPRWVNATKEKRIVEWFLFILLVISIVSFPASQVRAQPVAIAGYNVTTWATGFACCTNVTLGTTVGPLGIASDGLGNIYVGDIQDGNVYRFGRNGGDVSTCGCLFANVQRPHGLAFGTKDEKLYVNLAQAGEVVPLITTGPNKGTTGSPVASGIIWPSGLVSDPLTGNLFVSESGLGSTIYEIHLYDANRKPIATPYKTQYASVPNADGLAFSPNGTLYAAAGGLGAVVKIAGTDQTPDGQLAAWSRVANITGTDGMAISFRLDAPFLYSNNSGDGTITKIYVNGGTSPATIVSGGTRGDFATVGADGCLYATQTNTVIKVTNQDGSCPPAPLGRLFSPNPSISTALFASTSVSIPSGNGTLPGVVPGTSVYDTANVTEIGGTIPTGTVTYNFYTNGNCLGLASSSQTVALTSTGTVPNSTGTGPLVKGFYSFNANYSGDSNYFNNPSACSAFTEGFQAYTSVACNPNNFSQGDATTCTVTVSNLSQAPSVPGGTVTFSSSGVGQFSSSSCTLSNPISNSESCQVSFTTSSAGTQSITGTYNGDSTFVGSSGTSSISVICCRGVLGGRRGES